LKFVVKHKIKGKDYHDGDEFKAENLVIQMIPEFCELKWKPPAVDRRSVKCNLQKKLFTSVTNVIWHEK